MPDKSWQRRRRQGPGGRRWRRYGWKSPVEKYLIDNFKVPVLSIEGLKGHERELRRAHIVLAFTVQFYAQTVPLSEPITVPQSLTVPLLRVSKELQHAPFITYSDHALHNWYLKEPHEASAPPTSDGVQIPTMFTGTPDEKNLYILDHSIELEGAKAVELARLITDEILGSDDPDVERVVGYLNRATAAIEEMKALLMSTTRFVKPEVFYDELRPWFRGADADLWGREWAWEGREEVENSTEMLTKVSGPTAGQSPLVPTLDAYFGLGEGESKRAFLDRVCVYMNRGHDAFLQHLRSRGSHIRSFIQKISKEQGADSPVVTAYNAVVKAMKVFRDAHVIIVTLYAIVPSQKAKMRAMDQGKYVSGKPDGHIEKAGLEDSQGSQLMKLLKGFRDQVDRAYVG